MRPKRSARQQRAATNPRRVDGLEITRIEDGFMIHHPDNDRVHYLNDTAVLVLELSNGGAGAEGDCAALLRQAYKLAKLPLKEVDEALARMTAEGLVDTKPVRTPSKRSAAADIRKSVVRKKRG